MLAESLHHTRIIRSGAASGSGGGGTGTPGAGATGGEPDFGIDPNLDPELAIALRLSMETAEQERRNRDPGAPASGGTAPPPAGTTNAAPAIPPGMDVEDPEMAEALRLSMMTVEADNTLPSSPPSSTPPAPATNTPAPTTTPAPSSGGAAPMEDDDEFKKAMELSKQTADEDKDKAKTDEMDTSAISQDELASILKNLPGVDFSVVEQEMKKKEQEEKEKKKDQ